MSVTIYFADGHTVTLRSATKVLDESQAGGHSRLNFVCYDANDQEVGRFDQRTIRGYTCERNEPASQ